MKVEFMGFGQYTYECKDPNCYYCDVMNRKPLTDDESFRKNGWTPNEIKYLIENYPLQPIKKTCAYLNKTRGAVFTKICHLRKQLYIASPKRDRSKHPNGYNRIRNRKSNPFFNC